MREIWLSSEDTGAYGRDIGTSLPALLDRMLDLLPPDGSTMLRVGMTNPPYILESLPAIARCLAHPAVFAYLHVPVGRLAMAALRCAVLRSSGRPGRMQPWGRQCQSANHGWRVYRPAACFCCWAWVVGTPVACLSVRAIVTEWQASFAFDTCMPTGTSVRSADICVPFSVCRCSLAVTRCWSA